MSEQSKNVKLNQMAVKAMASAARGIAKESIEATSWLFFNQPKEPKDLAKRLQVMENK